MFRRLGFVFLFFASISATAYAWDGSDDLEEKINPNCDYGCFGRCGLAGVDIDSCRMICNC
jgi:hypothetical protein